MTVIAHDQEYARKSWQTSRCYSPGNGLEFAVAGFDPNPAAAGQSIASVENQVQKHLLRLSLVDRDCAQFRIETQIEGDVFADQPGQQVVHLADNFIKAQSPNRAGLRPGKNQQLLH